MLKCTGRLRPALALLLVSGGLFCQRVHSQSQLTSEDVSGVRKYVQDRMVAGQIPAIAISVVHGDEILWEEGFGLADREQRVPATPHTSFYLASITKALTGTAVMLLHDRGTISLDYPINDYLGEAKVHSPMWNAADATVRRVATHTAGLTTYHRTCAVQDTNCEASTVTAIRRYGILFWPPGDHFDYSNLGYGILGEVVGRVSREGYANFLRDEIFGPLDMEDCFLESTGTRIKSVAVQYDSASHARTPAQMSDTPGASSAHCSVHDLALFAMFARGEQLPSQKRILSRASLRMMVNPTVEADDGDRYGFGWTLQPNHHGFRGLYAQGGTNDSFAVLQMIPSEKIAVAVIANTGTTVPFEIVDTILSDLLPRYRETLALEKPAPPIVTNPAASSSLVGGWTGTLRTWKGDIPLAIEVSRSLQVRAKWAADEWMTASDVSIADPRFYCVIHGKIGTPDAPQSTSDIELELYLRKRSLVGAGTTKDGVQLPYWVQLNPSRARLNAAVQ